MYYLIAGSLTADRSAGDSTHLDLPAQYPRENPDVFPFNTITL